MATGLTSRGSFRRDPKTSVGSCYREKHPVCASDRAILIFEESRLGLEPRPRKGTPEALLEALPQRKLHVPVPPLTNLGHRLSSIAGV